MESGGCVEDMDRWMRRVDAGYWILDTGCRMLDAGHREV